MLKVESGYSGGIPEDANYRRVSSGKTDHAEVVQITIDTKVITAKEILEIFFASHDPTTPNRQGADVGPQYRSVVFFYNNEQKRLAKEIIEQLDADRIWGKPIVTNIEPFSSFYPAENYHVQYYERNREQPYCKLVIDPKIIKLGERFCDKLKR